MPFPGQNFHEHNYSQDDGEDEEVGDDDQTGWKKQRQCRYMKMHIRTMLQITLHYFVVPYKLRDTIPQVGLLSLFPGIYLRLVL